MYHFDLYRLESEEDLYEIGLYEYADVSDEEGVVLIEWPDRFMDCMPEDYLYIKIERISDDKSCEMKRNIIVDVIGKKYVNLYKELEKNCQF